MGSIGRSIRFFGRVGRRLGRLLGRGSCVDGWLMIVVEVILTFVQRT
jgi:hypothetical protein